MSLNNFHRDNYAVRPIYPDTQTRMNEYGYAYNQPRDWDIPNRVPVPRLQPSDRTNTWMNWLKDRRREEFSGNQLTQHYVNLVAQGNRTMMGDDAESLLLYNKWPKKNLFSKHFRYVPY